MRKSEDEFHWERVFRGMDEQLAARMEAIPSVLDLPGEDELLDKSAGKKKGGFPVGGRWGAQDQDQDAELGYDIPPNGDWRNGDGAYVYAEVERVAGNWLRALATAFPVSARAAALTILCRHGKLLGYAMDFLDAEWNGEGDSTGIKVALCKRLVSEAEAILADLENDVFPRGVAASFQGDMQRFRENVLTLLFKLRSDK